MIGAPGELSPSKNDTTTHAERISPRQHMHIRVHRESNAGKLLASFQPIASLEKSNELAMADLVPHRSARGSNGPYTLY